MATAEFDRLRQLANSDPEQFRKLIASATERAVIPHAGGQVDVLESKARFRVMNCGRRWGKTKIAAKLITMESRKQKQMLWWVAPTYKIVKRGYAEVLRQLPEGVLSRPAPPDSHFDAGRSVILRFKNGTRMEFYSAERPEGMLGEGVDFVVLDEAAIMPSRIWNQIVSPTLMDRKGGAVMISTPRGRNWFYRVWQMGQDPKQKDWASWTFPSDSNPTLESGEVDRMRSETPKLEADQEIDAKFIASGSATFYLPDRSIQPDNLLDGGFVEGSPPKGHVVMGVDLARTNDWTVFYAANMGNRRNVYFERMQEVTWSEQKRRLRRAVRKLLRAGATTVTLVMDSTGVGDPVVEDVEAAGYDVVPINFTTHKHNMVRLLAKDLEDAEAFVLTDYVHEFENYTMTVTPAGRWTYSAPEGEHDDVVAAKMLQHYGMINEGVPNVSMLSADTLSVDPSDEDDESDEFDDLLDDDMTDEEAAHAIGSTDYATPPTFEELMVNPLVWR